MFKKNKQAVSVSESSFFSGLSKWALMASVIIIVTSAGVWSYLKIENSSTFLPITNVRALGDFSFVNEEMLLEALVKGVDNENDKDIFENKGFFNIDVDAIKVRIEKIQWVKKASIQRVWPDTIIIEVVEHMPIAYWGDKGLVNSEGEVFYPNVKSYPKDLPSFIATQGLSANCLRYFKDASEMFSSINLKVMRVKFNARQALTLTLDNGVAINLGRQNKLYRLQRFSQVYSTLQEKVKLIERIDMRYTNGFSVKWKERQAKGSSYNKMKSEYSNV